MAIKLGTGVFRAKVKLYAIGRRALTSSSKITLGVSLTATGENAGTGITQSFSVKGGILYQEVR